MRGLQPLQIVDENIPSQKGSDLDGLGLPNGMHCTLKEMQHQLAELKAAVAMLSTKIEGQGEIRGGNGAAVRPNKGELGVLCDGLNAKKLDKGKKKVGFGPISISRPRRVWRVKRRSGSSTFEEGSTSGIGMKTTEMDCPSPTVT